MVAAHMPLLTLPDVMVAAHMPLFTLPDVMVAAHMPLFSPSGCDGGRPYATV